MTKQEKRTNILFWFTMISAAFAIIVNFSTVVKIVGNTVSTTKKTV
jgi:hypothetical protein